MKTISIPIRGTGANEILEYKVEFIGQIGSRAGKPYATEDSDYDYYVVLSLVSDLRPVYGKNNIRYTWSTLQPKTYADNIVDRVIEEYGHLLPSNFKDSDVKIDEVNHLFKELLSQSFNAYDKLFTKVRFYETETFKTFRGNVYNTDMFLNTRVMRDKLRGQLVQYTAKKLYTKAHYLRMKYIDILHNKKEHGLLKFQIPLEGCSDEAFNACDHKELTKALDDEMFNIPPFSVTVNPDFNRITEELKRFYREV